MTKELMDKVQAEAERLYPYNEAIVNNDGYIATQNKEKVNQRRRDFIAGYNYSAPSGEQTGCRWVKASERLPEKAGTYEIRTTKLDMYFNGNTDEFTRSYDLTRIEWLEELPSAPIESPLPPVKDEAGKEEGKDLLNDPFIQKHLKNIMEKTLDAMIIVDIESMWGGLEMASVQHFIEKGKINGSFFLRIKRLAMQFAEKWHTTAASQIKPSTVEDAVGFAEWISNNQFTCYNSVWTSTKIHYSPDAYKIEELYNLFKQSKTNPQ